MDPPDDVTQVSVVPSAEADTSWQVASSIITVVSSVNPFPFNVTVVPPTSEPEDGDIAEIEKAYVIVSLNT